jgi:hypothetical protein
MSRIVTARPQQGLRNGHYCRSQIALNPLLLCIFLSLEMKVEADNAGLKMAPYPQRRIANRAFNFESRVIQYFNPLGGLCALMQSHDSTT